MIVQLQQGSNGSGLNGHNGHNGRVHHSHSVPVLKTWYAPLLRVLDCLFASFLLVLSLPITLLGAILVKLTSRGPAFYTQTRLGLGGKPFRLYKLRTMLHECESISGPCWATPEDPRITPLGRILRRSHIDELPQLWNVLRGDLGLVGPRPERPEIVPALESAISGYRERLRIRPGLTGLAQIQLPGDTDLNSVRRKLACDLYYIHQGSLRLYLAIILGTAFYLLGVPFGLTSRILGIPRVNDIVHTCRSILAAMDTNRPELRSAHVPHISLDIAMSADSGA